MKPVRLAVASLALVGLIAAFTRPAGETIPRLFHLAEQRVRNWTDLEHALSTPGSGLIGMHLEVEAARELLNAAQAETYRLSARLKEDAGGTLKQRIEEVVWPIAYAEDASFLLRRKDEDSTCSLVAVSKGVALDRCQ